ncbi:hypothetical protein [Bacillus sp. AK128]
MLEKKLEHMEERITQLSRVDDMLKNRIDEIQSVLEDVIKSTSINDQVQRSGNKQLEEINEEMFQKTIRLRNLIEYCIKKEIPPTHNMYYRALNGDP